MNTVQEKGVALLSLQLVLSWTVSLLNHVPPHQKSRGGGLQSELCAEKGVVPLDRSSHLGWSTQNRISGYASPPQCHLLSVYPDSSHPGTFALRRSCHAALSTLHPTPQHPKSQGMPYLKDLTMGTVHHTTLYPLHSGTHQTTIVPQGMLTSPVPPSLLIPRLSPSCELRKRSCHAVLSTPHPKSQGMLASPVPPSLHIPRLSPSWDLCTAKILPKFTQYPIPQYPRVCLPHQFHLLSVYPNSPHPGSISPHTPLHLNTQYPSLHTPQNSTLGYAIPHHCHLLSVYPNSLHPGTMAHRRSCHGAQYPTLL